jgi:hypothetical protein
LLPLARFAGKFGFDRWDDAFGLYIDECRN